MAAPAAVLEPPAGRIDLQVVDVSTTDLIAAALSLDWTRDPFDRLICAHAAVVGGELATKDRSIRANFAPAFW